MTYMAEALLCDLGGEVSSRISFMSLSYDLSTVVPESRRITYGGNCCSSGDIESCYKGSVDGDAAHFRIGDTGMGMFLMVPRAGSSLC